MELALTFDEKILEVLFSNTTDSKKANQAQRINRHKIITSNKLIEEWEKEFKKNGLSSIFDDWLFGISSSKKKFEKVAISLDGLEENLDNYKEEIIIRTAKNSPSKIIIGDYSINLRKTNNELKFVDIESFSSDKKQTITMRDIEETLDPRKNLKKNLFNVFETPITIDIKKENPSILADYFSNFYDNTIIIQDKFLATDKKNENNLKNYILPFLDKQNTRITLIISTKDGSKKKQLLQTFKQYNIEIKCIEPNMKFDHQSFIKTSKYRITIPYRLLIFGEDGKFTTPDFVTITKLN